MSYVRRVLRPEEEVRFSTTVHWIVYWPGILLLMLAIAALYGYFQAADYGWRSTWGYTAAGLTVIGLLFILYEWFLRWITEIAVTSRRIIYKEGFIFRDTNEMQLDKVESVQVFQSIPGRILNYGDVTVMGTGAGLLKKLKTVAAPLELRSHIMGN